MHRPKTEIAAIEWRAGCLAKTSTPIPIIVVKAEKKIADLCASNTLLPFLYLLKSPSMVNMLKSSPIPNINVANIILTILNLILSIDMIPKIITQLMHIGRKVSKANSILPYVINSVKNTRQEVTSNMKLKSLLVFIIILDEK